MCVGVCDRNRLKRCKTSNSDFLISCRGAYKAHRAVPNEALYGVRRISRLITWTYLRSFERISLSIFNFPIFVNGNRLSLEPACRTIGFCFPFSFFRCTVVAICQGGNDLVQMDMLHLAMVLINFLLDPSRI